MAYSKCKCGKNKDVFPDMTLEYPKEKKFSRDERDAFVALSLLFLFVVSVSIYLF